MTTETKTVELPTGVTLEYVEQGDAWGVPVLFLHGLSDSWHSFERVLPLLPSSIHAFALSQRGHGDSARPAGGYAARDFAADIDAFMDALHLEAAVIVGHSMGSFAARRLAIDHPGRTLGIVLVGCFRADHPGLTEFGEAVSTLEDPVDPDFVCEFQEGTLAKPVPQGFFATVVRESLKLPAHVWKAAVAAMSEDDASTELNAITVPTLIVAGEHDELCPRSDQEALAAAIADARLMIYPGAGHGLHWEEPERFASDLVAFVRIVVEPE